MAMNAPQIGSVCRSDLIDSKLQENHSAEANRCSGCGHILDRRADWVGLPAGVKFDPTDQELIDHLEAKVNCEELRSHPLIDEFIPTIEGEDGICYTHPEKLPGVTKDGLSKHFFHRPSKAYTTGTRKRRKIQSDHTDGRGAGETRWHKTGKTRPVTANGRQKGCKKILVLYTNFGKHRKPEKTNWVMHQYHLGLHEEEREGELVVSKVFYQTQPRHCTAAAAAAAAATTTVVEPSPSRDLTVVGIGSTDELSCVAAGISGNAAAVGAVAVGGFGDTLTFTPFVKNFHQVDAQHMSHTCEDPMDATSSFHVSSRIGVVPAGGLDPTSIVFEEPYSRLILRNENLEVG